MHEINIPTVRDWVSLFNIFHCSLTVCALIFKNVASLVFRLRGLFTKFSIDLKNAVQRQNFRCQVFLMEIKLLVVGLSIF